MEMFRDFNGGFSLRGKYQLVHVTFVVIDGVRHAAIYEERESPDCPTYIQPLHDADLYRVAYKFASMCARFEFHPHG